MNNDALTLTVSEQETAMILEALGRAPFVQVWALIAKIQDQAKQQGLTTGYYPPVEAK